MSLITNGPLLITNGRYLIPSASNVNYESHTQVCEQLIQAGVLLQHRVGVRLEFQEEALASLSLSTRIVRVPAPGDLSQCDDRVGSAIL